MRISHLRHSLSVLRAALGISQKNLADLLGCTTSSIKRIENRELQMSEDLAGRIAVLTGAGFKWLLAGRPGGSVKDCFGDPINPEILAQTGKELRGLRPPLEQQGLIKFYSLDVIYHLARVLVASCERGAFHVCVHRITKLLQEMEVEYEAHGESFAESVKPGFVEKKGKAISSIEMDLDTIWRTFNKAVANAGEAALKTRSGRNKPRPGAPL